MKAIKVRRPGSRARATAAAPGGGSSIATRELDWNARTRWALERMRFELWRTTASTEDGPSLCVSCGRFECLVGKARRPADARDG